MNGTTWLTTADGVMLEAVVGPGPEGETRGAAVVCHPHPLYGGNMENHVVHHLAEAAAARGLIPVRFNFRGTGRSGGHHTGGLREVDDVAAAMDHATSLAEGGSVVLMGYSFGAAIAARYLGHGWHAAGFVAVALPQGSADLPTEGVPTLLVVGERDTVSPRGDAAKMAEVEDVEFVLIEGVDHGFSGGTDDVKRAVLDFLESLL
jgi:alpha/beta superfamily hydrolase